MFLLKFIIVLLPLLASARETDYVYYDSTGSSYKFHRSGLTWLRALDVCSEEGGYLAIIDDENEARVIVDIIKNNPNFINVSNPNYISVGIVDWQHNRDWYTIHGKPISKTYYSKWDQGEPNNEGGKEFCGSINRDGLYNDVSHEAILAYICERNH